MTIRSMIYSTLALLGGTIALAVIIGGILAIVIDLRIEMSGNGMRPIFTFGDTDDHFSKLELNRSQHYSRLLPPNIKSETKIEFVNNASPENSNSKPDITGLADTPSNSLKPVDEPIERTETSTSYWTDFRGPHRDGHYKQMAIRTNWPTDGLELLWNQPIGGGYASFVVAQERAFTIEQRREQEVVAAYDITTGRELWTHSWDTHFTEVLGGPGPRATPTWHAGRIYALGANGNLWSLDAITGSVVWTRNILNDSEANNLTWAMASSPLVVDDLVVVQPGGPEGWSIVAYDRNSGDIVWHALNDVQSYTSPMIVTLGGLRQILTITAERVVGLTLEDGQLLWEHPWAVQTVPNMAQPIVIGNDRIFISSSYGHGATVIQLTKTGNQFTVETVWRNNRMKNRFGSSVFHDGYIYGFDESILACIDGATGKLQWKGGRYGYGQLLLAGNHLVVLTERGKLVLVKASPDSHQEIASFNAIAGKTWNVPAIDGGRLLVRNTREMAAFKLSE